MNLLTILISSFFGQGFIGLIICVFIFLLFVYLVKLNKELYSYYNRVNNDLTRNSETGIGKEFFEEDLNMNLYEEFSSTLKKGNNQVNTGVIISKNFPSLIIKKEKFINKIPNLMVSLGLLGSFMGLALAVTKISGVIGALTIGEMDGLLDGLKSPLSSMGSAFWTSIIGLILSLISNKFNSFFLTKENYLNNLEDYLDNKVYPHFKDEGDSTVKVLAAAVETALERGLKEIGDKMQHMTIDMKDAAKHLTEGIHDMGDFINRFKQPVLTFGESVDNFGDYYKQMSSKLDSSREIVEDLKASFMDTVNAFNINKDEIMKATDILSESYKDVKDIITDIQNSTRQTDEVVKNALLNTEENNRRLVDTISEFSNSVNEFPRIASEQLKKSLDDEMGKMTSVVSNKINSSVDQTKAMLSSFDNHLTVFGEKQNGLQKLLETVK